MKKPAASTWFKLAGLAGVAGVAATGGMMARSQRQRRAYTPDEVRARLQARLAQAGGEGGPGPDGPPSGR